MRRLLLLALFASLGKRRLHQLAVFLEASKGIR
jgi:hypothetical protein